MSSWTRQPQSGKRGVMISQAIELADPMENASTALVHQGQGAQKAWILSPRRRLDQLESG